jgi:hypothetical protein
MLDKKVVKLALFHAVGITAYISLVAALMFNGERFFGDEKSFLIPVAMLLLFVMSAAITGGLTFGRSLLWYLDGRKKEAVLLAIYIVGWLFIFTLCAFGLNIIF